MGYYTKYEVEASEMIPEFDALMEQVSEYHGWRDGRLEEPCKWYEHEDQMRSLSEQHPSVLFTLRGEGESSRDIWVKYFRGGKMQECKARIVVDPFDPAKLA